MPEKAPNPVDRYVGSRVRMRRILLGLSQEKLGEALGLTFQQVQKYEKGVNRIGASRLQQLADVLGVPVGFFFEATPAATVPAPGMEEPPAPAKEPLAKEPPAPDYVSEFLATADGLALAKAFMHIGNSKLRHRIVDLVEEIARNMKE